ncbi:MAG: hypothetical protein PHQ52_07920, partial [Candidatus Omnitrophica bacterium]|nr:hypothetical protein [Candidatus Omnitrophota bacterium]
MKKNLLLTILASGLWLLASFNAHANNLAIENVEVRDIDSSAKTAVIRFDISWENSWRDTVNYDAVWVFAKYKDSNGVWNHVKLSGSGTDPTGYDVGDDGDTDATGNKDNIEIIVPTDKVGCFIQRSENETGTLDRDSVEILWDYNAGGLTATDLEDIGLKVFGIEMTYIPSGSFSVGDTESDYGQFEEGTTDTPLEITGEGALTLGGGGAGSLGNNNATGMATADDFNDATSKTLPANFPKGYNAFYCMKYELTQSQYRDFLNTLTLAQQEVRTAATLDGDEKGDFVMVAEDGTLSYRQTIIAANEPASGPYTFGCDLDDDNVVNEST